MATEAPFNSEEALQRYQDALNSSSAMSTAEFGQRIYDIHRVATTELNLDYYTADRITFGSVTVGHDAHRLGPIPEKVSVEIAIAGDEKRERYEINGADGWHTPFTRGGIVSSGEKLPPHHLDDNQKRQILRTIWEARANNELQYQPLLDTKATHTRWNWLLWQDSEITDAHLYQAIWDMHASIQGKDWDESDSTILYDEKGETFPVLHESATSTHEGMSFMYSEAAKAAVPGSVGKFEFRKKGGGYEVITYIEHADEAVVDLTPPTRAAMLRELVDGLYYAGKIRPFEVLVAEKECQDLIDNGGPRTPSQLYVLVDNVLRLRKGNQYTPFEQLDDDLESKSGQVINIGQEPISKFRHRLEGTIDIEGGNYNLSSEISTQGRNVTKTYDTSELPDGSTKKPISLTRAQIRRYGRAIWESHKSTPISQE